MKHPHRFCASLTIRYFLMLTAAWLVFFDVCQAAIKITFVAPRSTMVNAFGAAAITGGWASGYRGIEIAGTNLAKFQSVCPPNMLQTYNEMQSGQPLRQHIDKVSSISNNQVDINYVLLDDRTGLGSNSGIFCAGMRNGKRISWPCASVTPQTSGGRYDGLVRLGEESSNLFTGGAGGFREWESVILHETNHTQFVGEKTKWGSIGITYGGDRSHWTSEIMGGQALAFEEGLGTFYGYVCNDPAGANKVWQFFSRDDQRRYLLESWSVLTPNLDNVPHIEETHTPPYPPPMPGGRYAILFYRWWDVPGFYLLFSESTSTAFHTYFWKYVNNDRDQAYDMIINSSKAMWKSRLKRFLTYAVNRLALQLEDFAATPQGQQAKKAGTLTSSMFPFALLDILTHFGMSEKDYKDDYTRHYPDKHPRAYTEYWTHRAAVKQLVEPAFLKSSPILLEEAVKKAHRYFQQSSTIILSTP